MGYTSGWNSEAELIETLKGDCGIIGAARERVNRVAIRGTRGDYRAEVWMLSADGWLNVFLIGYDSAAKGRCGPWGYKDMTVSMGPCYHGATEFQVRAAGKQNWDSYGTEWLKAWGKTHRKDDVVTEILNAVNGIQQPELFGLTT